MKRALYITCLLFCSCIGKQDLTEQEKAIYGLWVAGESPRIQAVFFQNNEYRIAEDEQFELVFPDGEIGRFYRNEDYYELQTERRPQAGERVVLNWLKDNDTAHVVVLYPLQASILMLQNDTLSSTGATSSFVQWAIPSEGAEFALQLECTEEQPIPLLTGTGNFTELYNGPQVASQIELNADAFSFYGSHRLRISVLNDELLSLFFFDPSDIRGLLKNGPDNVIGGKGFVTATATTDVLLELE